MAGRLRSGRGIRANTLGMRRAAQTGRERVRGAVRAIALCRELLVSLGCCFVRVWYDTCTRAQCGAEALS